MSTRTAYLMPVYNPDPASLRRTLASMRQQSVPADIVVVDDGSTPPLDAHVVGEDVTLLRLPRNQGIVAALNRGLGHILAGGYAYVARMDCGDLCRPGRIATQQAFMDARPEVDLLGCHAEVVDEAGRYLFNEGTAGGEAAIRRKLFDNAAFKHPSFFFRTSAIARLGIYSDRYRHAEDYEIARRYAAGGRVDCLDDVLIVYEKNPTGLCDSNRGAQLRSRLRAQLRHFDPRAIGAYLGVVRTIVTMLVPARLWARLSRLYWRGRAEPAARPLATGGR
jgi:glycosyltransferase involved in cell wall biosynthesis